MPEGKVKQKLNWLQRRLDRSTPSGLDFTLSLAAAGLLLALFGGILHGIHETSSVSVFDTFVSRNLIGERDATNTVIFEQFTGMAGASGSLLLIAMCGLLLSGPRSRSLVTILASSAVISTAIVVIIKLLVARPRPDQALQLVQEHSFSFPSGHTMVAIAIYGVLAYFIAQTFATRRARFITYSLWISFAAMVAASRIYLGVHYPSDTLASASLGAAGLCLGLAWLTKHGHALASVKFDQTIRWRILGALAITTIIVALWRPFFI